MAAVINAERKIIIEFLKLYRNLPCLWYQQHTLYNNREAREQAYGELLEKYRTLQEDANIDTIRKKIDNLRCAYKRERKKVLRSIAEGNEEYIPTLWYYKYFKFLDGDTDADDTNIDYSEYQPEDDDYEFETDCEPPTMKKIKKEVQSIFISETQDEEAEQTTTESQKDILNVGPPDSHEAVSFGRTIGLQLKDLQPVQRYIAEKLISEVIFYARLEKLNPQSNITLNQE